MALVALRWDAAVLQDLEVGRRLFIRYEGNERWEERLLLAKSSSPELWAVARPAKRPTIENLTENDPNLFLAL